MADSSAEISGDEESGFVSNNELLVLDSIDQNKELVCIEYPGMIDQFIMKCRTSQHNYP